jgi:hypothetical protein
MSRSLRVASATLLALGGTLIAIALLLGAPLFGPRTALFLVPVGVGVLAALIGLSLRFMLGARHNMSTRAPRMWAESALVFALVIAVQIPIARLPGWIDVSTLKRNTLSEKSVQVARALTVPIAVEVRMARDDRAFVELSTLVERYRGYTDQLKLFRTDDKPGLGEPNVHLVRAAPGATDADAVRRVPLRVVAGAVDLEEQLTNALVALADDRVVRGYFLAGHGERELNDTLPAGLSRLAEALRVEGIEAVPLPLDQLADVPDDAALVAVVGPQSAVPDAEEQKLLRYLERGGRLLLMLDPVDGMTAESGLDSLAGSFGILVAPGLIIDDSPLSGLAGGPETATGSQLEHKHPITRPLGDALTHYTRARPLAENPGAAAMLTALVRTGSEAFVDVGMPGNRVHDAGEMSGPISLVMSAEEKLTDKKPLRLVVVGDTSCAENRGILFGANRDLMVNVVLWLAERGDKIAIRPAGHTGALLLLTPSGRERLALVLLYVFPSLLVSLGVWVRAWRRR